MPPPSQPSVAGASAVVRWPLLAALLPLLPLLVLLLSLLVSLLGPRQQQLLILDGDEPVETQPFRLEDGWLGSPLLELRAEIPPNSSLLLDVDLLDAAGQPVLQLSKEGWREVGTWQEDGESGTYDEGDGAVELALRPRGSGTYRLRLVRQELLGASGDVLDGPLRVRLRMENHSVDRTLLLVTALVAAVLVRMLWMAVYGDCRLRRRLRRDEGTVAERLLLGGPGLLRLGVRARYEEPDDPPLRRDAPPAEVPMELSLSDSLGRTLLHERQSLRLHHHEGSDDAWWTVVSRSHLRLAEPCSVRVRVSLPEALAGGGLELEWLELLVEDGVVTPWSVEARSLPPPQPAPLPAWVPPPAAPSA
ncbi:MULTISPECIES: hypothetical protein [Aphanothece]|uniref:hypothetical protein n=1 Tax=Aphanothece TaxID=1121 RepID=UPI00398531FC